MASPGKVIDAATAIGMSDNILAVINDGQRPPASRSNNQSPSRRAQLRRNGYAGGPPGVRHAVAVDQVTGRSIFRNTLRSEIKVSRSFG